MAHGPPFAKKAPRPCPMPGPRTRGEGGAPGRSTRPCRDSGNCGGEACGSDRAADLGRDAVAQFPLRHGQIEARLQVHPELGAVAEVARQAQRCLGADAALCVEYPRDPPRGHAQRQGELVGGQIARFEFALENPAGMAGVMSLNSLDRRGASLYTV